jgi:glycosyltransferase involved in cell wall biosynthesis
VLFHIIKHNPSWRLVIFGDGPKREQYQAMIAQLQIEDRVQLKGSVSRADIFGWCATADVFVLNTEFESFSYQIVEAMSVGAAIVTTNVGSIPELITDGVEGLLCEPNDIRALTEGIKSVVSNQEEWGQRKQAAKEKAQMFSITRTVEALIVVLKRYE